MSDKHKFDVFLAHNSKDKDLIEEIAQSLGEQGLSPWLDKDQILGGDLVLDELQLAIKNSRCAAFFIGKYGLGKWQQDEQRVLIQQSIRTGSRVIPVVLPHVSENFLESAELLFLSGRSWLKIENYRDVDIFIEKLVKSINKAGNRELTPASSSQEPISDSTIDCLFIRKSILEKRLEVVELEIERVTSSLRKNNIEPSLDSVLKWLDKGKYLAKKYGNIALKENSELKSKFDATMTDHLYIDIESYLKRIYYVLLTQDESLLDEPPIPKLEDEKYDFSPYDLDCMYQRTFQIIKQNIPTTIELATRSKLEVYIDQLVRSLRRSWNLS